MVIRLPSLILEIMTREYSKIEIEALQQLAQFRDIFYPDLSSHGYKPEKTKAHFNTLKEAADTFTEVFCQNNFADSDYSIMQNEPREFETPDHWINQINIDTILKCLTYIIWNNKIDDGYFLKKN